MAARHARILAALSLIAAAVPAASVPAAQAAPGDPESRWCSAVAPPCVEHAYRDGVEFFSGDPTYDVTFPWWGTASSTPHERFFQVQKSTGSGWSYDLGAAERGHRFKIVWNLGGMEPRVVWGWANSLGVARAIPVTGPNRLTVVLEPVRRVQCPAGVCSDPPAADNVIEAQIYGWISDASFWGSTEAEHDQLTGLNSFTNTDYTTVQPDIVVDPVTGSATMTIRMNNVHAYPDGTIFRGFQKLRLPNRMLREVYGIPDPATMTPGSLSSSVSGGVGTISTWQEAGDDAMHVDVSGVTFSARRLTVRRGTIVPTRPTNVRAVRVTAHRGRLAFTLSRPRGARVTGYRARCVIVGGSSVVLAEKSEPTSPVVVRGLRARTAYDCRVRATSRAGLGPWSAVVRMRARP